MKTHPLFVIQKHKAKTLHFDLRLQISRTLKSWAVPKGPPKTIGQKHLAIFTTDHPLSYANFEGTIPKGHPGAGTVKIWDQGTFENKKDKPLPACLKEGVLEFTLLGKRLKGTYCLVHMREDQWLWIKVKSKKI